MNVYEHGTRSRPGAITPHIELPRPAIKIPPETPAEQLTRLAYARALANVREAKPSRRPVWTRKEFWRELRRCAQSITHESLDGNEYDKAWKDNLTSRKY
jgi:hypothetical protein